jgi:hypothetical protein
MGLFCQNIFTKTLFIHFNPLIYEGKHISKLNHTKHKLRIITTTLFLISIISVSGFAAYAMQPVSIPTEVKEALEILDYPTKFSLYPGETINFNFTIENFASVNYFQEFEFLVTDTNYQKYVSFSNYNYSIPPGINRLVAWMTISPSAPAVNFEITINKKTATPTQTPTPTIQTNSSFTPSMQLLAGGIRWAAQEGKSALYINWKDNYEAHHNTDGVDWEWWSQARRDSCYNLINAILEYSGFEITHKGDVPDDLSDYDVVVIFAYYAVEPRHESLIREYVNNGGNVVLIAGTQSYLVSYSKKLSCSTDLSSIEDWFGASTYSNKVGPSHVAFDNPFDTSLLTNEVLYTGLSSNAAIGSLSNEAEAIAYWDSGEVFAFTHDYGAGRVYYHASFEVP